MSHIHIPDGVIAPWLWVLGYLLTGMYFFVLARHVKKTSNYKKLTTVSVLGALMLLSMSVPVPFVIPYHVNLSALTGILAGPFYAGAAIFGVNLVLALLGHGGITVAGLNTVILTIEAGIAYFLFGLIRKKTGNRVFFPAFLSTFLALVISALLTITVIYAGTQELDLMLHCGSCSAHHAHEAEFSARRFFLLVLVAGAFGWTLEAAVTGFIVNYINRVKPDLLEKEN